MGEQPDAPPLLVLTEEIGEGEIHVAPEFADDMTSLQQADLLNDWIEKLQDMYDSVTSGDFLSDLGGSGINQPPASGSIN